MPGAHTPRASCRARAERPSSFAVAPAAMLNTITSRWAHVRAAHALRDAPAECGARYAHPGASLPAWPAPMSRRVRTL